MGYKIIPNRSGGLRSGFSIELLSYVSVRLVPGGLTVCVGVYGDFLFCLETFGNQIPSGQT